ncbi:hypothetical protein Tco_0854915 [Tanacetum coccineum]
MEKSCTDSGMVIAKPGVGATTGFIIHWIVIFKNIKKVTKIADSGEAYDKVFNHLHAPLERKVLILTTVKAWHQEQDVEEVRQVQ